MATATPQTKCTKCGKSAQETNNRVSMKYGTQPPVCSYDDGGCMTDAEAREILSDYSAFGRDTDELQDAVRRALYKWED